MTRSVMMESFGPETLDVDSYLKDLESSVNDKAEAPPKSDNGLDVDSYLQRLEGGTAARRRTALPPEEEKKFQTWYKERATAAGIDPNPDDWRHKYDYRGAYKAKIEPAIDPQDKRLHWPSRFKDLDHPNRYVSGVDTIAEDMAGRVAPEQSQFQTSEITSTAPESGVVPVAKQTPQEKQLVQTAYEQRMAGRGVTPIRGQEAPIQGEEAVAQKLKDEQDRQYLITERLKELAKPTPNKEYIARIEAELNSVMPEEERQRSYASDLRNVPGMVREFTSVGAIERAGERIAQGDVVPTVKEVMQWAKNPPSNMLEFSPAVSGIRSAVAEAPRAWENLTDASGPVWNNLGDLLALPVTGLKNNVAKLLPAINAMGSAVFGVLMGSTGTGALFTTGTEGATSLGGEKVTGMILSPMETLLGENATDAQKDVAKFGDLLWNGALFGALHRRLGVHFDAMQRRIRSGDLTAADKNIIAQTVQDLRKNPDGYAKLAVDQMAGIYDAGKPEPQDFIKKNIEATAKPVVKNPQAELAVVTLERDAERARASGEPFDVNKRFTAELADLVGTDQRLIDRVNKILEESRKPVEPAQSGKITGASPEDIAKMKAEEEGLPGKARTTRKGLQEFGSTEEAIAFGEKATPDQVKTLENRRLDYLENLERAKSMGKKQESIDLGVKAQFDREAIEAAKEAQAPKAGLIMEELPPEVRKDAENTVSEDWYWNSEADLVWDKKKISVDESYGNLSEEEIRHLEPRAKKLVGQIKRSGEIQPVVIGPEGYEGFGRLVAAKMLGLKEIDAYVAREIKQEEGGTQGKAEGEIVRPGTPVEEKKATTGAITYETEKTPEGSVVIKAVRDGEEVGHAVFMENPRLSEDEPVTYSSGDTWVKPSERRKGIATGIYEKARSEGLGVTPSEIHTEEGRALQKSLADKELFGPVEAAPPEKKPVQIRQQIKDAPTHYLEAALRDIGESDPTIARELKAELEARKTGVRPSLEAEKSGKPFSPEVDRAERVIKEALPGLPIKVLRSIDDLSPEEMQQVRDGLKKGESPASVEALTLTDAQGNKHFYLFADKITDAPMAKAKAIHEVIGHYGAEKVLGKQKFGHLLSFVYENVSPEEVQSIQRQYKAGMIGEEIFARLMEKADRTPGMWDKIVYSIRQWAREHLPREFVKKYGFDQLTKEDIRTLFGKSYKAVAEEARKSNDALRPYIPPVGRTVRDHGVRLSIRLFSEGRDIDAPEITKSLLEEKDISERDREIFLAKLRKAQVSPDMLYRAGKFIDDYNGIRKQGRVAILPIGESSDVVLREGVLNTPPVSGKRRARLDKVYKGIDIGESSVRTGTLIEGGEARTAIPKEIRGKTPRVFLNVPITQPDLQRPRPDALTYPLAVTGNPHLTNFKRPHPSWDASIKVVRVKPVFNGNEAVTQAVADAINYAHEIGAKVLVTTFRSKQPWTLARLVNFLPTDPKDPEFSKYWKENPNPRSSDIRKAPDWTPYVPKNDAVTDAFRQNGWDLGKDAYGHGGTWWWPVEKSLDANVLSKISKEAKVEYCDLLNKGCPACRNCQKTTYPESAGAPIVGITDEPFCEHGCPQCFVRLGQSGVGGRKGISLGNNAKQSGFGERDLGDQFRQTVNILQGVVRPIANQPQVNYVMKFLRVSDGDRMDLAMSLFMDGKIDAKQMRTIQDEVLNIGLRESKGYKSWMGSLSGGKGEVKASLQLQERTPDEIRQMDEGERFFASKVFRQKPKVSDLVKEGKPVSPDDMYLSGGDRPFIYNRGRLDVGEAGQTHEGMRDPGKPPVFKETRQGYERLGLQGRINKDGSVVSFWNGSPEQVQNALFDMISRGDTKMDAVVYTDGGKTRTTVKEALAPQEVKFSLAKQTEELRKQVDTPEFKKWFGESKIVDDDGKPMVVYHGTANDFTKFKRAQEEIGMHFGTAEQATDRLDYLASARGARSADVHLEGENVMPVFLNIKNPLRLHDLGIWDLESVLYGLDKTGLFTDEELSPRMYRSEDKNVLSVQSLLEDYGYDGIVYKNEGETAGGAEIHQWVKEVLAKVPRTGDGKLKQSTPEYKAYVKATIDERKFREENGQDSYIAFHPQQIKSATGNRGTFDAKNPDIRFSMKKEEEKAPVFYSALGKAVDNLKQERFSSGQLLSTLRSTAGVKAEELAWTGLDDYLNKKQGPVTRAEVQEFLRQNNVEVKEVLKGETESKPFAGWSEREIREHYQELFGHWPSEGDMPIADVKKQIVEYENDPFELSRVQGTKYESQVLPGAREGSYRELLLTLPESERARLQKELQRADYEIDSSGWRADIDDLIRRRNELSVRLLKLPDPGEPFWSAHWDEPNVLAHVRFNERTSGGPYEVLVKEKGARGRTGTSRKTFTTEEEANRFADVKQQGGYDTKITPKGSVLFIEEFQSDLHQQGRKKGYRDERGLSNLQNQADALLKEIESIRESDPERQALLEELRKTPELEGEERRMVREKIIERDDQLVADRMRRYIEIRAKIDVMKYGSTVPDAPFKTTWPELSMKRMIRWAAEKGYDKIAWTTGEQQAERYDLSKQVDWVDWDGELLRAGKGGRNLIEKSAKTPEELEGLIGKEAAKKLVEKYEENKKAQENQKYRLMFKGELLPEMYDTWAEAVDARSERQYLVATTPRDIGQPAEYFKATIISPGDLTAKLSGLELKVGGEGMKGFYDQILPSIAAKLGKKFGAKVGTTQIETIRTIGKGMAPVEVHSLDITPAMKESVLKEGQPMFSLEDEKKTEAGYEEWKKGLSGRSAAPGGELQSTIIPGGKQFIEQDVIPTAQKTFSTIVSSADIIRRAFAPASRGVEAGQTASAVRIGAAELARKREMANKAMEDARTHFNKQPAQRNYDFVDSIERGTPTGTPLEVQTAGVMRSMLEGRWRELNSRGLMEAYIDDYFPHIWKDPTQVGNALGKFFGRRPLRGDRSFLKQRIIPTMREGLDLGLVPVSDNPVELVAARLHGMDKLVMAHDLWTDLKQKGIARFVKFGDKPPDGYAKLNDSISKIIHYSDAAKGMVIRGEYYLPEQAATVLNNHLSPGLQRNELYRAFRMLGNTMNQVQLGMSAFHLGFTSMDASVSKAALGIQELLGGKPLRGMKHIAQVPIAPVENYLRGDKLFKDYYRQNPQAVDMVDAVVRAGGRVQMDKFYHNSSVEHFWKALETGNLPGAALRVPGALIEYAARPIMEHIVPRQKLGVFTDMARDILDDQYSGKLTQEQATARLQEAWDSVDNRMGQLVYDNLFWNRALKDIGLASVRSLGWNLGTVRELGGGLVDFAAQAKNIVSRKPVRMTPRMAYVVALPAVAGLTGAILGYLYTGKRPEELKDYFFPKTGRKNPDGTEERVSVPSYMKDIFAYKERPLTTIEHKIHPVISSLAQMLENEDYYGVEIRNSDDPIVQQLKDVGEYWAKQYLPFSVRGAQQRKEAGGALAQQAESFVGITPAPRYIDQTPAEKMMAEMMAKRPKMTVTKEKGEARKFRSELVRKIQAGEVTDQDLQKAQELDLMDSMGNWSKSVEYRLATTSAERTFKSLTLEEALKVFDVMTPEEQQKYESLLAKKMKNAEKKTSR